MNLKANKALSLFLAVAMAVSLAACNKTSDPSASSGDEAAGGRLKPSSWSNPLQPPERVGPSEFQVEIPAENKDKLTADIAKYGKDVVAWLQIPNTTVNEGIVRHASDNVYYDRRDYTGKDNYASSLWMDYESLTGTGSVADLPQNTIIYGHHLGQNRKGLLDDPNGVKFGQLFKFADIEFAKANPYIYLTTGDQNHVYQIFSVAYTDAETDPEYIYTKFSDADFSKLVTDFRNRSVFDYPDVTVAANDKILTLSTCTYRFGAYGSKGYADCRFVVMAKLVTNQNFAETANVEVNADVKNPKLPYIN